MNTIQPAQLQERRLRGEPVQLLDVRAPIEHAEVHVPGVHLAPLDRLDPAQLAETNGFAKDQPVYILCRSGQRARQGAEKLEQGGFSQCYVVEGGTTAWAEAGLPVNRGAEKVISLERQVRIAAGLLVLAGALLARFVHPDLIWLSAFVGAGLMVAGIADWCGMGLLMASMPWNHRGADACSTK